MNDLLEIIDSGWVLSITKTDKHIVIVATKGTRILSYAMDPSHSERKLILLDTLNLLKTASKG